MSEKLGRRMWFTRMQDGKNLWIEGTEASGAETIMAFTDSELEAFAASIWEAANVSTKRNWDQAFIDEWPELKRRIV